MRQLCWQALLIGLACTMPAAAQETDPPDKKLDIRDFRPPSLSGSIVGSYSYPSAFNDEIRTLTIREVDDDAWPFQGGRGDGAGRATIKLQRAGGGGGFQGQASAEFDACLSDVAKVDRLTSVANKLVLELLVTHEGLTHSAACTADRTFTLTAGGKERVRLKPKSELKVGTGDQASMSYSLDAPRVAAGSVVAVADTIVDFDGNRWTQVGVAAGDDAAKTDSRFGWVRPEQVVTRLRYELTRKP